MDILTQLNRAMAYIEEHITDDIALTEVSSVTAYSPYHFGRLFYYIADMPLSEYIRKRKLSLAAMELQSRKMKVIDVALMYGYDSADSFARAFVKQHGVTPSNARRPGMNFTIFPPLTFQIKIEGVQAMNWRIEEKEAFEVFGIEKVFKNDETGKVPDFWTECHKNGSYEKLINDAGTCQPSGQGFAFGDGACVINAVCGYCEPGEDIFPYMLCALKKTGSKTDGYKTVQIPKTTWAVFRSDESSSIGVAIPTLFNRAYSEWLPSSGYDKALGPDMEVYYSTHGGKHFEEVWIPVKKQR
ncbi:MAG: AraC family transcriptional regulator [Clostridiales bacterium]|jgi:AraC family transcriptional regulator|nr:AraC family transcriptional regulator [Clostridiales bacterium]